MPNPVPTIPHDSDAEQMILGNCLLSESADLLAELSDAHFYSTENRKIYSAIRTLAESKTPINLPEVVKWLTEHGNSVSPSYVASLIDLPSLSRETMTHYIERAQSSLGQRAAQVEASRLGESAASGASVEEIREHAQRIVEQTAPKLTVQKKGKVKYLEAPEGAWYGLTKIYRAAMESTSEASDNFHLAGILTITGSLLGKSVAVGTDQDDYLFPNLYTVLVGDSGSNKDRASKRAMATLRRTDHDVYVPTTIASIESFIRELARAKSKLEASQNFTPLRILLRLSELRDLIEKTKQQGAGNIVPKLGIAYDCPDQLDAPAGPNPASVRDPVTSIFAATTPEWQKELQLRDLQGGLGSRVLFVAGDPKPPHRKCDPPDASCWETVRLRLAQLAGMYPLAQTRVFPFSAEAEARLDKWYMHHKAIQGDDPLIKFLGIRDIVHVYKIALIHACLDLVTEISLFHVEAAIAFVDWVRDLRTVIFEGHGFSPTQVAQAAIERIIKSREEIAYAEALKLFGRHGDSFLFKRLVDSLSLPGGPVEVKFIGPVKRPKRFLAWRG